jgi:hypothetical protein
MTMFKIIFINILLMMYGSFILWNIWAPGGLMKEIYVTYKKVEYIKNNYEKIKKKNNYYNFLMKEAKSGDEDTLAYLFFFKFNHPMKGYEKYSAPKTKKQP